MTRSSPVPCVVPVVISGGIGSRLWPLSRPHHPKPFLQLRGQQSLIEATYARALAMPELAEVMTVTHRELFFATQDAFASCLAQDPRDDVNHTVILEPLGQSSAPAVALAAQAILQRYHSDAIALILPADHVITDPDAFLSAVEAAKALAVENRLVTFGMKPDRPEIGYGYIEAEGHQVLKFVEKPDQETAEHYLQQGSFWWNTGMFCFKVVTILEQMSSIALL